MNAKTRVSLLYMLLLQAIVSLAQFKGCPMDILDDGDSLGRLVADTIAATANDQSPTTPLVVPPSVTVTRSHAVCISAGPRLGTISSASILVEYSCNASTACGSITTSNAAAENSTVVEQFDFGCQSIDGSTYGWTARQFGMSGSRVPTADFFTELRRDCSACIDKGVADALHIGHVFHVDPISRCLACSDGCADVGMGQCYGLGSNMCCNYHLNGSCVALCPNTTQPDSDHNCQRVVVGFEERVHLLDEGERLISLPVVIKEGELTQKVTLIVTTEDRTATVGEDYEVQNRRVQLVPGSNGGGSGSVRVMVPNDYLLEDDEEFVINLELMSGSSAFLDISSTIIVIIGDRDVEPSQDSATNSTMITTESPTTPVIIENGCEPERDEIWGLDWPSTAQGSTATITCGHDNKGIARRWCRLGAVWAAANVSLCENALIAEIGKMAEELFSQLDVHPEDALVVLKELAEATLASATNRSHLPRDLITVSNIVSKTVNLLLQTMSDNRSEAADVNVTETVVVLDILNTILTNQNQDGFSGATDVSTEILNSAEKYNQYVSQAMVDNPGSNPQQLLFSKRNVVFVSERISKIGTGNSDITFPKTEQTTAESNPASVTVPGALLDGHYEGNVSVTSMFFRDLHNLLPPVFDNGTAPKSFVASSEIYSSEGRPSGQYPFRDTPISFTFILELNETEDSPRCAFWDFSNGVKESGWSTNGLRTESVSREGGNVTVTCTSTHLTSFAVLVDVGGAKIDHKSLEVVSYIGVSVSIACLFMTIIFFASLGKKLFTTVHNFVHLNLSISLFAAYVIFAIGIEVATSNLAGCKAVAALIQYFLLSAFCWMMCEGVMLYLMLVVVFSRLKEKWWFFFMLGWGPPLIFVVIGLSSVYDEYGVRGNDGELLYCWLESGSGKHAIWTFVAPMLGIVLVNTVFLALVIRSIYISRNGQDSRDKIGQKKRSLAIYIVKASVILLPLLGLTWLFGLFAVNENTAVFAWLFTIFNSLQGLSIFSFHVLRNDRVWGRFRKSLKDPESLLRSFSSRRTTRSSMGTFSSRYSRPPCESEMEMKSHRGPVSTGSGIASHSTADPEDVFEPRESKIIPSPTNGSLNDDPPENSASDPPTSEGPSENLTDDDPPVVTVAPTSNGNNVPAPRKVSTTATSFNGILSYKI